MKKLKQLTAACLAVTVLLVAFTGCSKKGVENAMTLGDINVSGGLYLSYLLNSYNSAQSKVEDKDKNVLKQQVEGKDATAYIKEETVNAAKYYLVVEKLFADKQLELGDQDIEYAEYMLNYYWQNGEAYYTQNGVGYESLKKNIYNQSKAEVLFHYIYNEENGEKKVTKEEKQTYFNENFDKMSYSILPLTMSTGDKVTEEKQKEVEDMAKAMVEEADKGTDFTELANKYVKQATTSVGANYNEDTATNVSTELIDKTGKKTTTFSDEIKDSLSSLEESKSTYKVEDGRILVFKKEKKEDSDYNAQAVQVLVNMKGDEFKDSIKAQYDTIGIEVNQIAVDYYVPKRVKPAASN